MSRTVRTRRRLGVFSNRWARGVDFARARASRSTCTSPPRRAAARPRPHRRGSKPSTRGGAFEIVVVKTRRDVDDVDVADTWRDVDARHAAGEFLGSAPRAMLKGTSTTNDAARGLAPGCVFAGRLRGVVGVAGEDTLVFRIKSRGGRCWARRARSCHISSPTRSRSTPSSSVESSTPNGYARRRVVAREGFGHRLFGLGAEPGKHCAALGAASNAKAPRARAPPSPIAQGRTRATETRARRGREGTRARACTTDARADPSAGAGPYPPSRRDVVARVQSSSRVLCE